MDGDIALNINFGHCTKKLHVFKKFLSIVLKAKAYNTCIAPQAAYRSCSGAVHVTDSGRTADRPYLSLRPQTDHDQPTIRHPGLPFNGRHPRNTWITTHLRTPKGWKADKLSKTPSHRR